MIFSRTTKLGDLHYAFKLITLIVFKIPMAKMNGKITHGAACWVGLLRSIGFDQRDPIMLFLLV